MNMKQGFNKKKLISAELIMGDYLSTQGWNGENPDYIAMYKSVIYWRENELTKMAFGVLPNKDNIKVPILVFGAGDGYGNNRAYIEKGTNSFDMYYISGAGNASWISLQDGKANINGQEIFVKDSAKKLEDAYIAKAADWNLKINEVDLTAIVRDGTKGLNINKNNLNPTDVANWDNAFANAQTYINNKDTALRTDLKLTAPLPTSIEMNASGITATTTGDATKYARLDYRGLYINKGAIQIKSTAGSTVMDGSGVYGENIVGSYISTQNWTGSGGNFIIMNKQMMNWQESGLTKMAAGFLPNKDNVYVPIMVFGAGDGYGNNRAYIEKGTSSFDLYYISSSGSVSYLKLGNGYASLNGYDIFSKASSISDAYINSASTWNSTTSTFNTKSGTWDNKTQKLNTSGQYKTAASGTRIELTTGMFAYNSSGQLHGLYVDPSYSDMKLYYNNALTFNVYQDVSSSTLRYKTTSYLIMGSSASYAYGTWDFSSANVTGLSAGNANFIVSNTAPTDHSKIWIDISSL